MPPRDDLILFLDLETTGVDVPQDEIIEVGLSMVSTEAGYPEIGRYSHIVIPSEEAFNRMMAKDVVRKMHEVNGLLREIVECSTPKTYTIENIEQDILQWLEAYVGKDTTHIPFGGSGVLHFDRRFISYFMPKFDKRITHWAYDVGVLRRTFMKAGVKYASIDAKTHRALDDARVHAEEWRYYQEAIGGLERA